MREYWEDGKEECQFRREILQPRERGISMKEGIRGAGESGMPVQNGILLGAYCSTPEQEGILGKGKCQ